MIQNERVIVFRFLYCALGKGKFQTTHNWVDLLTILANYSKMNKNLIQFQRIFFLKTQDFAVLM